MASTAQAHVAYTLPQDVFYYAAGYNSDILLSVFNNSQYVTLILSTALLFWGLYFFITRFSFFRIYTASLQPFIDRYLHLILSFATGFTLITAGLSGDLLSPAAFTDIPLILFLQTILGVILLLLGGNTFVLLLVFVFFYTSLFFFPVLIGESYFLSALLSLFALSSLRFAAFKPYIAFILRAGIGVSLMFLGCYEKLCNPGFSLFFIDMHNLTGLIPVSREMWVVSAGVIEVLFGAALILGIAPKYISFWIILILLATPVFFNTPFYSHVLPVTLLLIVIMSNDSKMRIDMFLKQKRALRRLF